MLSFSLSYANCKQLSEGFIHFQTEVYRMWEKVGLDRGDGRKSKKALG